MCMPLFTVNQLLNQGTRESVRKKLFKDKELVAETNAKDLEGVPLDQSNPALGADELNLCEFPLAAFGSRAPGELKTLTFEDEIFDEGNQQLVQRKLTVSASDAFGLPSPVDSDVLLVLMHLTNCRISWRLLAASTLMSEALFRVLVIDDNRDAADTLALLLRSRRYDVKTVYSGIDAEKAAEGFSPHCIISDIGLPGLDGYALAERLRQHEAFRRIPLIALSAYSDDDRSKAAGFDLHLVKPASSRIIRDLLRDFAAMKKQVEQTAAQQGEVLAAVKELAGDVKELKQEITDVKEDVKEIKEQLKQEDAEQP